jgi:hypothetical protein
MLASLSGGYVNVYPITSRVIGGPIASLAADDLLAIGDANGDGRDDLLLGNTDGSMAVALDDGHGSFRAGPWRSQAPNYSRGQGIGRIVRGAPGVLVTSADQDTLQLKFFQVGSSGGLDPVGVTRLPLPGEIYGPIRDLSLADLNGDGNADFIESIEGADARSYIESLSQPDGSFTSVDKGFAGGDVGSGALLHDWNGDGCIDMVYRSAVESMQAALGLFRNDCTGTFSADFIYLEAQGSGSGPVALGDLDGDGIDDLAWMTGHYLNPDQSPRHELDLLFGRRPDGGTTIPVSRIDARERPDVMSESASGLAILGVFPDPADRSVTVRFAAAGTSPGRLELYDLGGRRVGTQTVGPMAPGESRATFELGAHLAPGIYWLRLTQEGKTATTRIAVVR